MTQSTSRQCLSSFLCTDKGINPSFNQVMKDAKINDSKYHGSMVFGELIIKHDDIHLYPDLVPILRHVINDAHNSYPPVNSSIDNASTEENEIVLTWLCDLTHHRKVMLLLKDLFENSDRFSFCGRSNHFQGILVRTGISLVDERSSEVVEFFFDFGLKTILGGDNLRRLSGFTTYYTQDYCINEIYPAVSLLDTCSVVIA